MTTAWARRKSRHATIRSRPTGSRTARPDAGRRQARSCGNPTQTRSLDNHCSGNYSVGMTTTTPGATPQIDVRRAGSRFHTTIDWLDSWHSFSFGGHYDPDNTHHGLLLVSNDDVVRAGAGFGTHPHADMEIVTWVLEGELEHRDSIGTDGVIYPGLAQRMSAGTGHPALGDERRARPPTCTSSRCGCSPTRGDRPGLRAARPERCAGGRRTRRRRLGTRPRRRGVDPPARRRALGRGGRRPARP